MGLTRQTPRPLLELSNGLGEVFQRLQPASPGATPSQGDRVARLRDRPGPLGDAARELLSKLETALRGLDEALEKMEPWLVQFDVVLAYTGVLAAAIQGGVEAGAGLASLSAHAVGGEDRPNALYDRLMASRDLPEIKEAFDQGEDALLIVPPPEDVAVARAAIARLLDPTPASGARSLSSLNRAIARSPSP